MYEHELTGSFQWSSRGRPVKLIDKKPDALEAALVEIDKFRTSDGKETGHKGGVISIFGLDELDVALEGAWLAVEVRTSPRTLFQT